MTSLLFMTCCLFSVKQPAACSYFYQSHCCLPIHHHEPCAGLAVKVQGLPRKPLALPQACWGRAAMGPTFHDQL